MDVFEARINHRAQRDLQRVPAYIKKKLFFWIELLGDFGLAKVREIKSFHDEPLHGDRYGQRSIRLNAAYRAFYVKRSDGTVEFIEVIEVNKHGY